MGLEQTLSGVQKQIKEAAQRCGRTPDSIVLLAVTKGVSAERVREAIALGISEIGENRVQEARAKREALSISRSSQDSGLNRTRWHLIGSLQRNKVRQAAELFDAVHSIESLELVDALERVVSERTMPLAKLEAWVQVNVSGEASKHGCRPENAAALVSRIRQSEHLQLSGFMTIAPFAEQKEQARPHFRALRQLRDALASDLKLDAATVKLSMGMSHDFEVAIEEGADIVRIGTALFGPRA